MKIYNVMWNDRHVDTTATPFLVLEEAIEWARKQAVESCVFKDDFEEPPLPTGWLYYVIYSSEGDSIWITEHEIIENEN